MSGIYETGRSGGVESLHQRVMGEGTNVERFGTTEGTKKIRS